MLDQLIDKANEAYQVGALEDLNHRKQLMETLVHNIIHHKEALKDVYCRESSLSISRFELEFNRTLLQIETYLKAAEARFSTPKIKVLADRNLQKKPIPIGPVAVFGASNFPLAYSTLGGDVMGALAAGCPVIVKGHSLHAGTSLLSAQIIQDTLAQLNLHPGIFGHVLDDGYDLGQRLVSDLRIQAVGFTGSKRGGMALFKIAQKRAAPLPFFAEMGSINPIVFLNSTEELEKQLAQVIEAVTHDAGQFCTKPGVIFMPKSRIREQMPWIRSCFSKAPVFPMLHPNISQNYLNRLSELKELNVSSIEQWAAPQHYGNSGFTCISLEEFSLYPTFGEEIFGPFCVFVSYETEEELVNTIQSMEGQLTGSIFGHWKESPTVFYALSKKVGRIVLNGVPTGVVIEEEMHHGGPFPSSTDARFSAVGQASLDRFIRYLTIQETL